MKLTLNNFFGAVKELVMGGGYAADGVTVRNDAGFLVDRNDFVGASVLAASVTRITASNYPVLNAAAGITAVANFSFVVPRDYDEATDELHLNIVALMAGATDVPTLTIAARSMVTGAASGVITPVSGSPTAALSTTAQKFDLLFRKQALKRDMILSFTVTSAAHATDALQVQELGVSYRSTLVSYNETDNANGKPNLGNRLR